MGNEGKGGLHAIVSAAKQRQWRGDRRSETGAFQPALICFIAVMLLMCSRALASVLIPIGMAVGTKFYLLAAVAAIIISLVIVLMTRLNWYARDMSSQILRIQVRSDVSFDMLFNGVFAKYTRTSELVRIDSVHSGMLTELTYSIGLKKPDQIQEFIAEIRNLNGHNRVTLTAGYNGTDL